MKQCSRCKKFKDESEFHKANTKKTRLKCRCKECRNLDNRNYYKNNSDKEKKRKKLQWEKNKKNPEYLLKQKKLRKEYYKKNRNKELKNVKLYRKNNPEKINKIERKHRDKRKRNLRYFEFIKNIFPEDIEVDYHHINNIIVFPIPRLTHQKNHTGETNKHREIINNWVEKIYQIDLKILGEN